MDIIVPYIFFLYMFISTWIVMMNYEKINNFSSSRTVCVAFISLTIAMFTFLGVATLYHKETKKENFKKNIDEFLPHSPFQSFF